ncbi:hypothetical protein V8D89_011170 [Ganoderma adspersum]
MSLPRSAQVLVVGAGPAGITLALALQQQGCPDVVIVDSVTSGQNTSRAVAVHAATIEALETLGIADALVREGVKLKSTVIWSGNYEIETEYFEPLSKYTKYNYMLGIPQHITEKVLNQAAEDRGISVLRPFKVVDMRPSQDDSRFTDVIFDNGHVLRARTVVGADGARSTIRQLTKVGWADPSGEVDVNKKDDALASMIVADITASNPPPFPQDAINLTLSHNNVVLWLAFHGEPYPEANLLKGETVYRIAIGIPPTLGPPPAAPDTAYLQDLLETWGPNKVLPAGTPKVTINRTIFSSRFRTHSAIADSFFAHTPSQDGMETGPVLLIGDAGHIHPPVGGQGMSLGIRDAVKLAPILTEFVRAASSHTSTLKTELERPLADWATERRSKALTVISLVKRLTSALSVGDEWQHALGFIPYNAVWVRDTLLSLAMKFEFVRANNAYELSGLANP